MDPLPLETEVERLPVGGVLGDVRGALGAPGGSAVLVAAPGAGKSTVVPAALLQEAWLGGQRIVMLEPRRLAARAAAARIAWLLGESSPGGVAGYRVRNDTRVGPRTRVEVVTEGVLTRLLQSDPALEGIGLVVFDEFHERSVHADLGLALVLQSRSLLRPDLRILVMSATLDAAPVARLLDGAPVIRSEGRTYPVETRWRRQPVEGWVEPAVARTVVAALERDAGDVLAFLPGAAEIRRTRSRLAEAGLGGTVSVHALFGALPREEQERAIAPSGTGRRKVVLATSIAETSLTIEGVRVVVDAGLMRVARFDPGAGMTRLETLRVTRDAADQRRGRAGRTAPGVCYRLWTRAEERGLVPHRRPEILDADLAPLALELAAWGAEPGALRWLDPPAPAAYRQALELLRELDAIDDEGAITAHGRAMAGVGLHPRLAHMVLRGAELGRAGLAADLAALLGERDPLRPLAGPADADLRLRLDVLRQARGRPAPPPGHALDHGALRAVRDEAGRVRRALAAAATGAAVDRDDAAVDMDDDGADADDAGWLTALAYPDRIARRREGARGQFLLRNGRGAAFVGPQPLAGAEWLAVAEVDAWGADARIFRAAPLTRGEVEAHFAAQIEARDEVAWDAAAGRVVARRVRALGALTIQEAPLREPPSGSVAAALLEGIREAGLGVLPWSRETVQLRQRLEFLHRLEPSAWPPAGEDALAGSLREWLLPFLAGMTRLDELRRLDLREALLTGVPWDRRRQLDELAPTHLVVPSGSRVPIDYADPAAPALAVRLQEVFGLTETPRIAGGRVPLTLRLLSPAHRPVQVTQDLASFWRDAYFEVRKDLRGRYPRHHWPEDPLQAEPTRRAKRRP